MLLPIEKGCKAIIINSNAGNTGKCVVVGNYIGDVKGLNGVDRWEVDLKLQTKLGVYCNTVREMWLMRIDGHREENKEENKSELLNDKSYS